MESALLECTCGFRCCSKFSFAVHAEAFPAGTHVPVAEVRSGSAPVRRLRPPLVPSAHSANDSAASPRSWPREAATRSASPHGHGAAAISGLTSGGPLPMRRPVLNSASAPLLQDAPPQRQPQRKPLRAVATQLGGSLEAAAAELAVTPFESAPRLAARAVAVPRRGQTPPQASPHLSPRAASQVTPSEPPLAASQALSLMAPQAPARAPPKASSDVLPRPASVVAPRVAGANIFGARATSTDSSIGGHGAKRGFNCNTRHDDHSSQQQLPPRRVLPARPFGAPPTSPAICASLPVGKTTPLSTKNSTASPRDAQLVIEATTLAFVVSVSCPDSVIASVELEANLCGGQDPRYGVGYSPPGSPKRLSRCAPPSGNPSSGAQLLTDLLSGGVSRSASETCARNVPDVSCPDSITSAVTTSIATTASAVAKSIISISPVTTSSVAKSNHGYYDTYCRGVEEADPDSPTSLSSKRPRGAQFPPPFSCASPQRHSLGLLRPCRYSSGLVFNPGSATVECVGVQSLTGTRRFSFAVGVGGQQTLTPCSRADCEAEEDVVPVTPVPTLSCDERGGFYLDDNVESIFVASPNEPKLLGQRDPFAALSPGELFAKFLSADSPGLSCATFSVLLQRCRDACICPCDTSSRQWRPFEHIRHLHGLPRRAQSVWKLYDTRLQLAEYAAAPLWPKVGSRTRALVCGAGPCGLRAALELSLLSADVHVLERRGIMEAAARINRVHLWEWCKQDLLAWGAKVFDPPGGAFGGDNDFCHIGIGELQLLLLKNALLLGVRLRFGCSAEGLEGRHLLCRDGGRLPCDVLLLCDGANSPMSRAVGLRTVESGLLGKGSAIGVVANFVNNRDPQQMALRQFSWARQFNGPLFKEIERLTGFELENAVYYKGGTHHYCVMTPTKRSLLAAGVLLDGRPENGQLLDGANVSVPRLSEAVQQVAEFFGLPKQFCESQGIMIFDFSGVRRVVSPSVVVGEVFVCACGDALLEPFWPEGLGIMRGFMSALDASAAAVTAATQGREAAAKQLSATYNVLKSVAAQSASQCLQKDHRLYRLAPETRYIMLAGR